MVNHQSDDDWRAAALSAGIAEVALAHAASLELAGHRLMVERRPRAAEAVYRELLRRVPTHRDGLVNLIAVLGMQGRRDPIPELYRRLVASEVARLDHSDEDRACIVAFRLAEAGFAPCPDRAPAVEVARRFDAYAEEYDSHLLETLRYRGPDVLMQVLSPALGEVSPRFDILDLGCGTGLAGERLKPWPRRLDGVDLAPAMLEKARARGIYDRLECADAASLSTERTQMYDIIVALEVLIYLGDLAPVFQAVATALKPNGVLAFTVEAGAATTFRLHGHGRFAHHPDYIRAQAAAAGFSVVALAPGVVRREQGSDVDSLVGLLKKV